VNRLRLSQIAGPDAADRAAHIALVYGRIRNPQSDCGDLGGAVRVTGRQPSPSGSRYEQWTRVPLFMALRAFIR
jgi:hypothetical protein